IVADALAKATIESCHLTGATEIARFGGRKLEYSTFAHPFLDRQILGVLADYVTTDQGTGVVHTAPSHGAEDFYTGVKYKLDQTCNVDAAGRLRNGLPEYDGLTVFKANQPIIELLALPQSSDLPGDGAMVHLNGCAGRWLQAAAKVAG